MRWFNGYYNDKSKIESKYWLTIKQEVGEVKQLDLTILQQLIYISIKSDVIVKFHLNLKHEKNLTVDEFLGSNWREGLKM